MNKIKIFKITSEKKKSKPKTELSILKVIV